MKVDAKTKTELDEWKKKKWRVKSKGPVSKSSADKDEEPEEGEAKESDDDDDDDDKLDEFTMRYGNSFKTIRAQFSFLLAIVSGNCFKIVSHKKNDVHGIHVCSV